MNQNQQKALSFWKGLLLSSAQDIYENCLKVSSLIVKTYKNNPLVDLYSELGLILAKSLFLVTFIINKLRTDYHY